jgi:cytidine deaminase
MQKRTISISFDEYTSLEELNSQDQILCLEAKKAMSNSHSPYSGFRVGVAVQLESGKIVYGSNQENVAYPSGLCAERVALFMIGTTYPDDIKHGHHSPNRSFFNKRTRYFLWCLPSGNGRV